MLHGGASRSENVMVSPTQLSVLRMIPIARRIGRQGNRQVAVFRLLNSRRGWDAHHTPVNDCRWAIEEAARRLGQQVPVCLVGHSLGGRAALLAAGHEHVRSVVALAAYVYADDVAANIDNKQILFVHGSNDRIASPARAHLLARRLDAVARVQFLTIEGGKHAMLRHHREFSRAAAEFAIDSLNSAGARYPG